MPYGWHWGFAVSRRAFVPRVYRAKGESKGGDCCIKANRCVAFGLRLRSHTEVCSLQTSPSAPCASSFLQSLDNLASKIVRLLTFATVSRRDVKVKKRAPTAAAIEALALVSRREGYFASSFLRTSYSLRPPLRKSIYLLISVSWAYDALSGLPAGSMAM